MAKESVNVAIIGLGFGAEFIPIYQNHPKANMYGICRRNEAELKKVGDAFGVQQRYTKYEDVLSDPKVDFVHINSPIPDHAWMSIEALKAGKHVMCTVPMATTIEDCEKIVNLVKEIHDVCLEGMGHAGPLHSEGLHPKDCPVQILNLKGEIDCIYAHQAEGRIVHQGAHAL